MPTKSPQLAPSAGHRIKWFVYVGFGATKEKIRHTSTMRGQWGYDVECSCGWKTNVGGGTRRCIEDYVYMHKLEHDQ